MIFVCLFYIWILSASNETDLLNYPVPAIRIAVYGKCVLAFCGRLPDCCWMRKSLQLYFQLLDDIVAVWTDGIF